MREIRVCSAEPAAVASACACGRDRLGEAAQPFAGVRGRAAVALVPAQGGGLGGDGLGRRSAAGPWPAVPSSRRRSCAAQGGTTIWPRRPVTSAVTRGGSVQHVATLGRGARPTAYAKERHRSALARYASVQLRPNTCPTSPPLR